MERKTDRPPSNSPGQAPALTPPEIIEQLETALAAMSEPRRTAFLLLRRDHLCYREIAERTGLTVRQVEREIAKALLQLDDALHAPAAVPLWRRVLRLVAFRRRVE